MPRRAMMDQVKKEALKSLLKFGIGLGSAIENALKDGKFEPSDIIHFKDVLFSSPMVFSSINILNGGLGSIGDEDKKELEDFFVKEFDLSNDKLEIIIEESVKLVSLIYSISRKIKA